MPPGDSVIAGQHCKLLDPSYYVSLHVNNGFPKKLDGGWVGGVSSIQVWFWIFGIYLTLQSP